MENVFDRRENITNDTIISDSVYNLLIGLVLCWGFFVNYLMVKNIPYETIASINIFVLILGYLASCFIGVSLFAKSDVPIVSFIGYNFVVVPFGLIINLIVYQYSSSLVLDAIQVTGMVTLGMMLLGTMFPVFFQKIAGALTAALIVVIIVEVAGAMFFGFQHGITDWAVAVIFCGYIGVDWGRANAIPKTVDNAIDSAASLYMDIINLFIRILRIMGSRR